MSRSATQGIQTALHPVSDLAAAKPVDPDGNVLGLLQDR